MTRFRLLVAGIGETNQRLSDLFSDCDLTFVDTMSDARAALAQSYDAVLVAVGFDESRMFELLRYLQSDSALSRTPVICYRSGRRALAATVLGRQAVELASRALGASDFVDLISDPDVERGNLRFRETVRRAVESGRAA